MEWGGKLSNNIFPPPRWGRIKVGVGASFHPPLAPPIKGGGFERVRIIPSPKGRAILAW
jgi:hypothetical protein